MLAIIGPDLDEIRLTALQQSARNRPPNAQPYRQLKAGMMEQAAKKRQLLFALNSAK
jgi:hypothetical protein